MLLLSIGGKRKNYKDFDEMIKKLGLTEINEDQRQYITKQSRRGNVVYADYDPYDSEINEVQTLIIGDTEEEVQNQVYQRKEDI